MLRLEAQLGEVPLRTPDWHSALNKLFGLQASAPHPPEGLELDDVAGYNNAMHACKQAGLWQRCLQLLGNMESKELQADAQTVATAMSACERGGHWQQAVSLLAAARERRLPESAAASNTVVNVCANNRQWQQALEVLSDMGLQRLRSAMTTRNSLLGACGRGSTWSAALAILVCQEVDAFGYNAVLTACVKSRQWQQGIQVFEAMDVPHDGISYELGVSACSKGVQWYQCLQLISTMKDIRLQPSAMTCSVALSMCQKFSRWQEALDLLEGDNVILNCKALSALSRGLQWQQAVALFSSMRERQAADQLTYTTLMGAFHKSSSWRQALALLQDLDAARLEVDEPLLHAAMCACEDAGQWQKAGTFCKGALAASAAARRIQVLANKGQWHEALALLASAPSPRSALAVLAALRQAGAWQAAMALVTATAWGTQLTRAATAAMRTTAEASEWALTLRVFAELEHPDVVAFNTILGVCRTQKLWEEALLLLQEFAGQKLQADRISLLAAVGAAGGAGRWPVAILLAERSGEGQVRNAAMGACSRCSEWQQALCIFKDMQQASQADLISYNTLISACGRVNWPLALWTFAELQSQQLQPDLFSYGAVLSVCTGAEALDLLSQLAERRWPNLIIATAAISACARSGMWQDGLQILRQTQDGTLRPSGVTFNTAMEAAPWPVALLLLQEHPAPDSFSYHAALTRCANDGAWEAALQLLPRALRAAEADKEVPFCNILLHACREDWRRALHVLKQLQDAGVPVTTSSYNTVLDACGKSEQWQWSVQMLEQLGAQVDDVTWNSLINLLSQSQQWQRSLSLLDTIKEQQLQVNRAGYTNAIQAYMQGLD